MKGLFARFAVAAFCLMSIGGSAAAGLAGGAAPDFVLKGVSGANYRLSEYRGRVVLVSFWASWCGDCRSQLRRLAELHERYADTGLTLLSISLDRDLDEVRDTAQAVGVGFPALHDAGGIVGERYAVDEMPYVVLIDQDGVVRYERAGFRGGVESEYLEQARALLGE